MPRRGIVLFIMPILLLAWFFVLGGTARAATIPIEADTIWTKAQSPITINDFIWLKSGINLTIEKGAVIKFTSSGMLIVSGRINAIGTEAEPIVFTSINDDSVGGDTNGDGAGPQAGDWYYLSVNTGGEANLDYATVQYGGGQNFEGAIKNYKGILTIAHSTITNNNAGLSNNQGVLTISHSAIINNLMPFPSGVFIDAGISNNNRADIAVSAINNWWGSAQGPCPWRSLLPPGVPIWQVDIKAICGDKPLVDSGVVYSPWLTTPPNPDPIILVPGIMGSWEVNGEWKLDPILHTYDNLWQALKNAGYVEGETLFAFPYEWRQSNTLTAYQLKQKINEVKSICNCNKVDIVGHSMGGLVARAYAESNYYNNDIDQLVFLGTPHKGSPESYLRWEAAEGFEDLRGKIVKLYFALEAHNRDYDSLFNYIQDYVKSVEQLLPDYAYLQDLGETGFRIYDKINYPNNYPYNTFLENINSAEKINQLADSGIRIMNFIGDTGDNTINIIKVSSGEPYWPMWKNGYAEESIRLTGDGTVPEVSSSLFIPTKIDGADHLALPTKAQSQVIEYLTGNLPALEITDTKEPKKLLVVRIFSPADFMIIAPNGKRLGKDFTSDPAVAVNEIPGAFYSGFNADAEFAAIPDPSDGEYKVEVQGVNNGGEYTLANSLIDGGEEITKEFSGSIQNQQQRDFSITYSAQAENPLSDLEPVDNIDSTITDIKKIYELTWLKGKIYRPLLISAFKLLEVEAKYFDKERDLTEKLIKKTQDDKKLTAKQKQKLIEQYNKKLNDLKKDRAKAIDNSLDLIEKLLNTAKKQNQLNQLGYDIIISDINYLRENL